jgi:hypothetical protein
MKRVVFEYLGAVALLIVAGGLCCCAPARSKYSAEAPGFYQMSTNRLYEEDGDFDLRKTVIYAQTAGTSFNSDLLVSNKTLTSYRCAWCHECGFPAAWDLEHVGQPGWNPRYKGDGWQPIVQRMRVMDGSMLNEEIADRIYTYLRDESTGKYDESQDTKGAVIKEVDKVTGHEVLLSPEAAAKQRQAADQQHAQESASGSGTNQK